MAIDQKDDIKITYATMSGDQLDRLHAALDQAIVDVKRDFGRTYPMLIAGSEVTAAKTFADESPIDTRVIIGQFQSGGREHVQQAIAAARKAYPAWSALSWQQRVAHLRKVADVIRKHRLADACPGSWQAQAQCWALHSSWRAACSDRMTSRPCSSIRNHAPCRSPVFPGTRSRRLCHPTETRSRSRGAQRRDHPGTSTCDRLRATRCCA